MKTDYRPNCGNQEIVIVHDFDAGSEWMNAPMPL